MLCCVGPSLLMVMLWARNACRRSPHRHFPTGTKARLYYSQILEGSRHTNAHAASSWVERERESMSADLGLCLYWGLRMRCLGFCRFTHCWLIFFFLINLFIYLFIYFWLRWVFVAAHGLSLVVVRGLLFVVVCGLIIAVASLCCGARSLGMRASVVVACGLSSCSSWAPGHRLSSCGAQA